MKLHTYQHESMSYLIDDYLAQLNGKVSDRTYGAREEVLRRLHNELPFGIGYAAGEQIEAWLNQPARGRERQREVWTRITYLNHIRAFYRWATKSYELDGDPSLGLVRPRAPQPLPNPVTDDELALALTSREPWFTAVVLAAYAGLRCDEIARAQREHITQTRLRVPRGKGGKPGVVPTHPYLWAVVKDRPDGHLFVPARVPAPVTGRWIPPNARSHFDRLGLPGVHMHRFRDWYGTMIQEVVGDVRVTQECLRHSNLASVMAYTLVATGRRSLAVASLPVPGAPASR